MKIGRTMIFCLSILLLLSSPVFADIDTGPGNFNTTKMIAKLIVYVMIFVVIVLLALYGTKFIAKNFSGVTNSKYIKILDTISISANMRILIAEINGIIYLLAMTNEKVELLDKVKVEDFKFVEKNESKNFNNQFKDNDVLNMLKKLIDKEDKNEKKY